MIEHMYIKQINGILADIHQWAADGLHLIDEERAEFRRHQRAKYRAHQAYGIERIRPDRHLQIRIRQEIGADRNRGPCSRIDERFPEGSLLNGQPG